MIRNLLKATGLFSVIIAIFLLLAGNAFAQEVDSLEKYGYALEGKVTDKMTGEGVSLSCIRVFQNMKQVGEDSTDIDGNFSIESFPNLYGITIVDIEVTGVGYKDRMYTDVILHPHFVKIIYAPLDKSLFKGGCSHHVYEPQAQPIQLGEPGTRTYTNDGFKNRYRQKLP